MSNDVRGRFLWHELLTSDPDAAARFYGRVTGWALQSWDQDASYRLLATAGVPMAGLLPVTAGTAPHWLTYVGVADVDAAVQAAVAMGGTVRSAALDVPTIGRMAELADPQGGVFSVYAPTTPPAAPAEPSPGDFSWHELATTSWQAAWEFYSRLFGWEHESSFDMGPAGTYWMFRRAGGAQPIGGIYTRPPEMRGAVSWLPYVLVADADRAAAAAGRSGGAVVTGPMDIPGGDRIAVCNDPQGAGIGLHSLKPAAVRRGPAKKPVRKTAKKAAPKPKRKTKGKAKPKGKARSTAKAKAGARRKKKTAARRSRRR